MHNYDKMAFKIKSPQFTHCCIGPRGSTGRFDTLSFFVWIWLINSALAVLHGTVHSNTPNSSQSLDCHFPFGK